MMYHFELTVRPKCKKNARAVSKTGRIYTRRPEKENERWLIQELWHQARQMGLREPIEGPVEVRIVLRPSRADIVNQAETVLDALQGGHAGKGTGLVLRDDGQAAIIQIEKRELPPAVECMVSVFELGTKKVVRRRRGEGYIAVVTPHRIDHTASSSAGP